MSKRIAWLALAGAVWRLRGRGMLECTAKRTRRCSFAARNGGSRNRAGRRSTATTGRSASATAAIRSNLRFEPRWLLDADATRSAQHRAGRPAGLKDYRAARSARRSRSIRNAFTLLGPQAARRRRLRHRQQRRAHQRDARRSRRCRRSPISVPTAAACGRRPTAARRRRPGQIKTDFPEIASMAIGDITFDPNNHNVLYAGTGDLRYGSFSFGSAGVLKSTDKGETWSVLGEDVFNPFYGPSAERFSAVPGDQQGRRRSEQFGQRRSSAPRPACISRTTPARTGPARATPTRSRARQRNQRQDIDRRARGRQRRHDDGLRRGRHARLRPRRCSRISRNNGANGVYRATMPDGRVSRPSPTGRCSTTTGRPCTGNGDAADDDRPHRARRRADRQPDDLRDGVRRERAARSPCRASTSPPTAARPGRRPARRELLGLRRRRLADVVRRRHHRLADRSEHDLREHGRPVPLDATAAPAFTNLTNAYCGGPVHPDNHARAFVGGDPNKILNGNDGGVYYFDNATAMASPRTGSR